MKNRKSKGIAITVIAFIIILIIALSTTAILECGNEKTYTITSIEIQTEIQTNESKVSTKYLYFCKTNNEETIVFENEDSMFNGKFNSSDILAKLKQYEKSGECFIIITKGYRIPLFSMYQNIISIKEIS